MFVIALDPQRHLERLHRWGNLRLRDVRKSWPGDRFYVQHDLKVRVEIFIFLIGLYISSGCLQTCYVAKNKRITPNSCSFPSFASTTSQVLGL